MEPGIPPKPVTQTPQSLFRRDIAVEVLQPPLEELPKETLDGGAQPSSDYPPEELLLPTPERHRRPIPATPIGNHLLGL